MKAKVVKKTIVADEGLAEMFNQMIGNGNIAITYPKYIKIRQNCEKQIMVLDMLANSPVMSIPSLEKYKHEILKYTDYAKQSMKVIFALELAPGIEPIQLPEVEQKAFDQKYIEMRKSSLISDMVKLCDKLIPYKKHIEDLAKLNHKFIALMPGVEWCPFHFTTLNIKYLFAMPETKENTVRFFMTVLNKTLSITHQIWKDLNSPDVDIDQFVNIIMTNIDEIQKRPELSRCRRAFKKIKDSVSLLKNNFDGYYKDFLQSSDSTIIMQHFILDVSKETNADPQVTAQFRTIIAYYRKIASAQITNPKLKMLFDKVNESFSELEKNTENLVNIKADSKKDDDEPDQDANTSFVGFDVPVTQL